MEDGESSRLGISKKTEGVDVVRIKKNCTHAKVAYCTSNFTCVCQQAAKKAAGDDEAHDVDEGAWLAA